jgi:HAMP domain-containing protein
MTPAPTRARPARAIHLAPRTIQEKLRLSFGLATGLLLAATVWIAYQAGCSELDRETDLEARRQVEATADVMGEIMLRVCAVVRSVAARQEAHGPEPDPRGTAFLAQVLGSDTSRDIYGLWMDFEHYSPTHKPVYQWVDRGSWPHARWGYSDHHDETPETLWYQVPKRTGRLFITEPYFDRENSDLSMVSVSYPVRLRGYGFIGVAGADMTLDHVRDLVAEIQVRTARRSGTQDAYPRGEYAYLVSREGKIIVHPDSRLMIRGDFGGADYRSLADGRLAARSPGGRKTMAAGGGRRIYWATVPLTGWKIVFNVPEGAIRAPAAALATRGAAVVLAGLFLTLVVVVIMARQLTRPIETLTSAAVAVEDGTFRPEHLDASARSSDELGHLARVFQRMAREVIAREQALRHQVRQLTIRIDEKRRQKEVAEITETEFFKELQQKAQEMRQAASAEPRGHPPLPDGGASPEKER